MSVTGSAIQQFTTRWQQMFIRDGAVQHFRVRYQSDTSFFYQHAAGYCGSGDSVHVYTMSRKVMSSIWA